MLLECPELLCGRTYPQYELQSCQVIGLLSASPPEYKVHTDSLTIVYMFNKFMNNKYLFIF